MTKMRVCPFCGCLFTYFPRSKVFSCFCSRMCQRRFEALERRSRKLEVTRFSSEKTSRRQMAPRVVY